MTGVTAKRRTRTQQKYRTLKAKSTSGKESLLSQQSESDLNIVQYRHSEECSDTRDLEISRSSQGYISEKAGRKSPFD